jgi:hypothetical protein
MRLRATLAAGFLTLAVWGALALKAQRPFKEYPGIEYENFPLPDDYLEKTDWTRARLRYPDVLRRYYGRNLYWTMDYPRSDRHLLEGVRRLTRINTRSVEQIVDLDGTDDIYNWPVTYAVEVGHWDLPEEQAKQLRDYIDRGGFFMCDDFHGSEYYQGDRERFGMNEWENFMASMRRVFPDELVEDIPDKDPIFHTLYDLDERFQVPGAQYFETGITYEKGPTGKEPHWRCIRDKKGRIVAAICHNMDLGDAWEHSDEPRYLEKWASLAYRVAMNYFVYDLTH